MCLRYIVIHVVDREKVCDSIRKQKKNNQDLIKHDSL